MYGHMYICIHKLLQLLCCQVYVSPDLYGCQFHDYMCNVFTTWLYVFYNAYFACAWMMWIFLMVIYNKSTSIDSIITQSRIQLLKNLSLLLKIYFLYPPQPTSLGFLCVPSPPPPLSRARHRFGPPPILPLSWGGMLPGRGRQGLRYNSRQGFLSFSFPFIFFIQF